MLTSAILLLLECAVTTVSGNRSEGWFALFGAHTVVQELKDIRQAFTEGRKAVSRVYVYIIFISSSFT